MCVYVCLCVYLYVYVCMYVGKYIYKYVICMYVGMYVYKYVCMCICVLIMCIYTPPEWLAQFSKASGTQAIYSSGFYRTRLQYR